MHALDLFSKEWDDNKIVCVLNNYKEKGFFYHPAENNPPAYSPREDNVVFSGDAAYEQLFFHNYTDDDWDFWLNCAKKSVNESWMMV